jgi:hypothetical protein
MTRSNRSARSAGQKFERLIADYLRDTVDPRRDIRPKNGRNDRGDLGGVHTIRGGAIVVEVKNTNRLELAEWIKEAEAEAGNADADAGVVIHKRKGKGAAGDQWVTMSAETFAWLLLGGPKDERVVVADPHTIITDGAT